MTRVYKPREIAMYMDIAQRVSEQSYAIRSKVGAVFVAASGIMSVGYNGTPAGDDNNCEDKIYSTDSIFGKEMLYAPGEVSSTDFPYEEKQDNGMFKRYRLVTKSCVLHAEENILAKALDEGISLRGGDFFQTMEPCMPCAKLIRAAKVNRVYYRDSYRLHDGIDFLKGSSVQVIQVRADGTIVEG